MGVGDVIAQSAPSSVQVYNDDDDDVYNSFFKHCWIICKRKVGKGVLTKTYFLDDSTEVEASSGDNLANQVLGSVHI